MPTTIKTKRWILALSTALLLALLAAAGITAATLLTEDFDTLEQTIGYYTGDLDLPSGTWTVQEIYKEETAKSRGGTGTAMRLNDDTANAYATAPAVNSAGTVSFWYREYNNGGGTFQVQKSVGGGSYVTIASQAFSGETYQLYSLDVNEPGDNVRIRIVNDNNPGHLILDDFEITDYTATALTVSKSAPTEVDAGARFTYTLTAENYTGGALSSVTITDVVPSNATFARAADGGQLIAGDIVSWTTGSLADGASVSVRFAVTATGGAGNTITNDTYAASAPGQPTAFGSPWSTQIGGTTAIYTIQGDGFRSPLVGQTVETAGIVLGFFEGNSRDWGDFNGFYIQAATGDGDPDTSDGIFVKHDTSLNPGVSVGDLVTVSGTVDEFSEFDGWTCSNDDCQTQIYLSGTGDLQVGPNVGAPAPVSLAPPGDEALATAYWEAREGMLVSYPTTLTVVGPTSYGTVAAIPGTLGVDHALRTGPYAGMPVGVRHYLKYGGLPGGDPPNLIVGSVIQNADGPLAFTYGDHVIITQASDAWQAVSSVPEPAEAPAWPEPLANEFTVATLNTLNFDATSGAKMDKIIDTIVQMNCPTFVALQEIEMDATLPALESALSGQGCAYDAANSHEDVGNHGVALIWRSDQASGVSWSTAYQGCSAVGSPSSNYDPLWATCQAQGQYPLFSRRPVVVTGTVNLNGTPTQVVLIANHFKSKAGNDPADNQRRLEQGQLVAGIVDSLIAAGSANVLVLGDLNDFEDAPPLDALYASGNLTNTWYTLPEQERYSYIYRGTAQNLDHILASPGMMALFDTMGPLHYNADFPFKRPSTGQPYEDDATVIWRASDHDPVAATFARVETYTSQNGGGHWTTPGTWDQGAQPGALDAVVIAAGTTVTVNVNAVGRTLRVEAGGTLVIPAGVTLNVENGVTNEGRMRQTVGTVPGGSATRFLRIQNQDGDAEHYRGVDITPGAAMSDVTVEVRGHQLCTDDPTDAGRTVQRCFAIEGAGGNATITFHYLAGELGALSNAAMQVWHWGGSQPWVDASSTASHTPGGDGAPYYRCTAANVNSYSPFLVGLSSDNPNALRLHHLGGHAHLALAAGLLMGAAGLVIALKSRKPTGC